MTSLQQLNFLVRSQLRYMGWVILGAISAVTTAGLIASLLISEGRQLGKAWGLLVFASGLALMLYVWVRDLQERRNLGWLQLPIPASILVTARLVTPLAIHGLILVPMVLCLPIWYGKLGADGPAFFTKVSSLHAISLMASMLVLLSEEITVIMRRFGTLGVILAQIAISALLVVLVVLGGRFGLPELDSTPGTLFVYSLSVLIALAAIFLYRRRNNYLLGVDACTSLPVDWSRSTS
ncbi:MAG: hypothetical protein AAGM22_02205 [Acidobacteriota bacterium]